jgi:predicted phosphodiesterase
VAEARQGYLSIVHDVLNHAHVMSSAYRVQEIRVLALGDIINGELHGTDSVVENEIPPPVQVVEAGRMISEALAVLSSGFPHVRVEWVVGNHDRMDMKMPNNRADERSWGYSVAEWVTDQARRLRNVEVVRHADQLPTVEINGLNLGLAHGHGIRMFRRLPFYGMRDFLLGRIMEALEYAGPVPDMVCLAHFHQHALVDDGRVLVLPSHIGNAMYARNAGYRGRPAQLSWFIGKHGPFGYVPWRRQPLPEVAP